MCCDVRLCLCDYTSTTFSSEIIESSPVLINNEDATVCGRTMEFSEPLISRISIVPRGKNFCSKTPSYSLEWVSRFGHVAIKILDTDIVVDGMNEIGLSCGILTLDATKYSPVTGRSISILNICSWILSLCETVEDASELLKSVQIYGETIPMLNRIIGLHIVIHDSKGSSIVCELSEHHIMNIYYTHGVITNGPYYPQQLEILNAYINENINLSYNQSSFNLDNLRPSWSEERDPSNLDGLRPSRSEDRGSLNLNNLRPSWSSITRFVKLSELKRLAILESRDSKGLVQLLCHMFNNVDIIRGLSSSNRIYGKIYETTQWCLIKDLTLKQLYYRSYNNMTLRHIDLTNIDFSGSISYPDLLIDDFAPATITIIF